jgi:predicted RND superfamily exporter protein
MEKKAKIATVYTGVVPVVYKAQRTLLESLIRSTIWAFAGIAIIMIIVVRSPSAGLISMVPNVFPVVIIFGAMGWYEINVDIGSMMCASVAMGVAVDDTIHFWTWFRRGLDAGLDRLDAIMLSYERCATAMTQTTLIGGLGLSVFALSTFTPTQRFGVLMLVLMFAALLGDLVLLPAILAGPLGRVFAREKNKPKQAQPEMAPDKDHVSQPVPTQGPHGSLSSGKRSRTSEAKSRKLRKDGAHDRPRR